MSGYQLEAAGVAPDGETEEDDLHHGQHEDEQHHADVAPHAEEVLLDQRTDLASGRPLEGNTIILNLFIDR